MEQFSSGICPPESYSWGLYQSTQSHLWPIHPALFCFTSWSQASLHTHKALHVALCWEMITESVHDKQHSTNYRPIPAPQPHLYQDIVAKQSVILECCMLSKTMEINTVVFPQRLHSILSHHRHLWHQRICGITRPEQQSSFLVEAPFLFGSLPYH